MTSYSVFFFGELKYRLNYLLLSFVLISFYGAIYVNDLFIHILYPVNKLNIDLDLESFINLLSSSYLFSATFDIDKLNISYDYYPVFEINITNNTKLYKHVFFYCYMIFLLPVFVYHVYLFILPGLFVFEYSKIGVILLIFWLSLLTYIKYFHSLFLSFLLFISYNNFYEYYNYEFDIEFDVNLFLMNSNSLIILFILNSLLYLSIIFKNINRYNNEFKILFIFLNCYFFLQVATFIFFLFLLYNVLYWNMLVSLLKNQH